MKPSQQQSHTIFAQNLFNGIASSYDAWAQVFTGFHYLEWRRFLVSRMALHPGDLVLDASTGTAGVALAIARRHECKIIGTDITPGMLEEGRRAIQKRKLSDRIQLVPASAENQFWKIH